MMKLSFAGSASYIAMIINATANIHDPHAPMVALVTGSTPSTDDDTGPPNPNAPAVDTTGMPWDDRIHSAKKGVTDTGAWRKRRGVDAATIAAVEAELKARGSTAQPQMQFTPPTNNIPPPQGQPQYQAPPVQQQYPPQGQPQYQAPPVQQQYPPQGQPQAWTLNSFMGHLSGQMQKRDATGMPLINADYLARVTQELSQLMQRPINHIAEIGEDQNAITNAINIITRDGKWLA